MMNTVRHTFQSLGGRGSDIARSVGYGTADLAKRVGDETANLARQIGPRRALIGLAVAAVAIGGSIFLLRYLRARRSSDGINLDREDEDIATGRRSTYGERTRVPGAGTQSPF